MGSIREDKALPIVRPTTENINLAAEALLRGELVCIPTETVYGIAADATNSEAIKRIYEIKDRPSENPLIVHISDFVQLDDVVAVWTKDADVLANRFWPGPLTLVVKKSELIPDEVTGGLDTVAVRMPDHPVALEVIEAAGVPLAAPSANRFMGLSPTSADAVSPEIASKVYSILDGGTCRVGLESTVVDVSGDSPRILRPGGISRGDIQAALGKPLVTAPTEPLRRSPGMYYRHYAPRAKVMIVDSVPEGAPGLVFGSPGPNQIPMPKDPSLYAAMLYAALNQLDQSAPEVIYVEKLPEDAAWEAIVDRVSKASSS